MAQVYKMPVRCQREITDSWTKKRASIHFSAEHGAPALIVMLSTIIEDRTEQNGIEMEMDADGVMVIDLPTLN